MYIYYLNVHIIKMDQVYKFTIIYETLKVHTSTCKFVIENQS